MFFLQIRGICVFQKLLNEHPEITHVSMVHSETTSGILNDIASVAGVVKASGRTFIVDAMSSFGGVDIPTEELGIDFIISSANKCIQGVPGFSFIICRRDGLAACKGKAKSLSLAFYLPNPCGSGICPGYAGDGSRGRN